MVGGGVIEESEPDVVGTGSADVEREDGATVRSLMQYRHLIASSWISSAQYGHFFTSLVPSSDPPLPRLAHGAGSTRGHGGCESCPQTGGERHVRPEPRVREGRRVRDGQGASQA